MTGEEIDRILRASEPDEFTDRTKTLNDDRLDQDNQQSRRLFAWAIRVVTAQLLLADVVFIVYAAATWAMGENVPGQVMAAWLAATVVEVVGIVAIIARSLFPPDKKNR